MAEIKNILIICMLAGLYGISSAQTGSKYFYHSENISANFFDAPQYAIDSVLFFNDISGDTIIYWTIASTTAMNKNEIKKLEKKNEFGKYIQRGLTMSDGRIMLHRLSPHKYLLRNDSLYEWSEIYSLTLDSIEAVKKLIQSTDSNKKQDELHDILNKNTSEGFVFIFSPHIFDKTHKEIVQDKLSRCPNMLTLLSQWATDSNVYYQIQVSNNCDFWGNAWGYILSDKFEFVSFGGYSSKEAEILTKENQVFKSSDE